MFGVTFIFAAALWALPLAALPVLLHLSFRRRGQIVPFPTLRFLKASVRHAAPRRKVRRRLLLACRVALLALLVWAVAQPVRRAAAGGARSGASSAAVVVVDTSYSNELRDGPTTILARADAAVRALLAGPLRGARVALLRSAAAPGDRPELAEWRRQEQFRDASAIRWTTLTPQPTQSPLVDRVALAAAMLEREPAGDKWLVVISDLQRREFPRPLAAFTAGRAVLIDLHPDAVRNVAVTRVDTRAATPAAAPSREAVVELTGRPDDGREVNLSVSAVGGAGVVRRPPQPARLDAAGRATVTFPFDSPQNGWARLEASVPAGEPLAWAAARSHVYQVPPRPVAVLLPSPQFEAARRRVGWALDPAAGKATAWPLTVRAADDLSADAGAAVLLSGEWPDEQLSHRLIRFVRAGHTLIWFVRPGLEETWATLSPSRQAALSELLPGRPLAGARRDGTRTAAVAAPRDPALAGLTDAKFQVGSIAIERMMLFDQTATDATPLLTATAANPAGGLPPPGLVYRRPVGAGVVFTIATLPEKRYSTLYLHPIFPPMLVQMATPPPPGRDDADDFELGRPLVLTGPRFDAVPELRIRTPQGAVDVVRPTTDNGVRRFVYSRADLPGLYTWHAPTGDATIAVANVQPPADEADLQYAPAASVIRPGPNVVVTRSVDELSATLVGLSQPQPRWSAAIGVVLVLLCCEAMVGGRPRPGR